MQECRRMENVEADAQEQQQQEHKQEHQNGLPPYHDSLERDAGKVTGIEKDGVKLITGALMLRLAFQSIGVVYGDIGTSPLYVFASTFPKGIDRRHTEANILGVLSLIIYTLTLSPLIKYVFLVLRANDNGEGGTFALYSLLCRHVNVGLAGTLHPEDRRISSFKLENGKDDGKLTLWIKSFMEGSKLVRMILLVVTFLGVSMVIGDGTLTPAISVLSAVQGIQVQVPSLSQNVIVIVSSVILVLLFNLQRFGTDKVGFLFAPALTVWFAFIGGIGLYNIVAHDPSVLRAFNPKYIVDYFVLRKSQAFISLGGVVLCITGTEAMFADLGHFSVRSIQTAFTSYVYPSLLLAYIGQASYLMKHPEDVGNAFYNSVPRAVYWPMFVVSVLAAIIASQAMISAVFQMIKQADAMSCFPRVKVTHTSKKFAGQVYIPEMNWFLMCACVAITAAFRSTTTIGNAYGICVVSVMFVTTIFTTIIMVLVWKTNLLLALGYLVVSGTLELTYFSSVLYKFKEGGWLPVLFAAIFLSIMFTWFYCSSKRYKYELDNKMSVEWMTGLVSSRQVSQVRGVALVYTELFQGIPSIISHYVSNLPAMHSVLVFVTIKNLPVSNVIPEERFLFRRVGTRDLCMYRCVARYGYKDTHRGDDEFEESLFQNLADFVSSERGVEQHNGLEDEPHDSDSISLAVYPMAQPEIEEVSESATAATEPSSEPSKMSCRCCLTRYLPADASVEEELEFLEESRKAGVVYVLGDTDVRARRDANILSRFLVDYAYAFLRKNFREGTLALNIPNARLLKIGTTTFI